jgi:hypothetical protein
LNGLVKTTYLEDEGNRQLKLVLEERVSTIIVYYMALQVNKKSTLAEIPTYIVGYGVSRSRHSVTAMS